MIKFFRVEDFISVLNAVFGLLSILMIFLDQIRFSFIFILLAVLADGLDGYVARRNGNKSQVGDFLEPMADMMSMAAAPVFFTYNMFFNQINNCFKCQFLLIAFLVFFFICAVVRLSSFFVLKKDEYFIGVPVPASALIIVLLSYLRVDFYIVISGILLVSIFMISNFHFKKPWLKVNILAVVLIFLAVFFNNWYNSLFIWILLFAVILYSIISPIYQKVKKC